MSSRAARKLQKLSEKDLEIDQDFSNEIPSPKKQINFFDILEDSLIQDDCESEEIEFIKPIQKKKSKKKSIKEQQKLLQRQKMEQDKLDEFHLEQAMKEVELLESEIGVERVQENLFVIDCRLFDGDAELRRYFGRIVDDGSLGKRRKSKKRTVMINPKDTWPPYIKAGLSMDFDSAGQVFKFQHSKSYQAVQVQFMQCVETLNPDNIVQLLRVNPYHIDSLLQLAYVMHHNGDINMAADFVERCIYSFERSFHPKFLITSGNAKLSFDYVENRPFFIAIFRHIDYLSRKGCWRAAFEFQKLLYSLNRSDPLSTLCYLDVFAIKSKEFEWLLKFQENNQLELPNFLYSVSLAQWELDKEKGNALLDIAIRTYPNVCTSLFEKQSLSEEWMKSSFFQQKVSNHLQLLQDLYVEAIHTEFKVPAVLEWLKSRVAVVEQKLINPTVKFKREIPLNLCRMIFVSDKQQYLGRLNNVNGNILAYDPFPPETAIPSVYDEIRNQRLNPTGSVIPADASAIQAFFQSLFPWLQVADAPNQGNAQENQQARIPAAIQEALRGLFGQIHPDEEDEEEDAD